MYKLMVDSTGFPKVVSSNSHEYAELLHLQWKEKDSGTKKYCEELEREMLEEMML